MHEVQNKPNVLRNTHRLHISFPCTKDTAEKETQNALTYFDHKKMKI